MPKTVQFQRPDGASVSGYLAEAEAPLGAVVVIQEWWGLNEQIRGVARRWASAGFTALVPDLYRGKSTVEEEEAHHLMTGLDFGEAASQDVRGAVSYLKGLQLGSGKVGVTGYCMGGALTLLSSMLVPEADAAVVWYGMPPVEYVDASKIRLPLQAHWALQDEFFAIAGVDALEARLREAGARYEGHRYLAHHGFANETAQGPGRIARTQYDAAWAQQAWDRAMRFFGQTLG
ncbi:dienelactone hydrolase family protein [Roseateles saccharophilus]|uniref:Carboxymethylenebutenolidase n=1 Tax=Roseateles saccharophilus TaxID=304 RepID=A0A4R3UME8_ROSSA|nr:dienelactone hydrolase family protein [Roseateles saccharophilus]MDG0836027.1 dienelactone hydrolase family protein [Roseateles saccharophilus]TCU91847.1 carboxymethylenebutenolidase [Roseateles saccharophilus]